MLLQIYQVIKVNRSLEVLINQHILYNINIAYKILKLKKELDEIETYVFERFNTLCPNANLNKLNETETILYNSILTSPIEVNVTIKQEDILSSNVIKISIEDIDNILLLFDEKSKINS